MKNPLLLKILKISVCKCKVIDESSMSRLLPKAQGTLRESRQRVGRAGPIQGFLRGPDKGNLVLCPCTRAELASLGLGPGPQKNWVISSWEFGFSPGKDWYVSPKLLCALSLKSLHYAIFPLCKVACLDSC